jgi:hypothetical protein
MSCKVFPTVSNICYVGDTLDELCHLLDVITPHKRVELINVRSFFMKVWHKLRN